MAAIHSTLTAAFEAMQERNNIVHSMWALSDGGTDDWERVEFPRDRLEGSSSASLERFYAAAVALDRARQRLKESPRRAGKLLNSLDARK